MKAITKSIALLLLGVATIGLSSCEDDNKDCPKCPDPKECPEPEPCPDPEPCPVCPEEEKGEEVSLKGDVTEDMVLKAVNTYTLDGALFVKKGASLTIPAGTTITAAEGFDKYILVEQGGKIFINGTAEAPVVMTCSKKEAGAWGGLILNGYAPLTSGQKTAQTEINSEKPYGGDDPADNSGSINYLIISYCGAQRNDNVEHNTITLNGVGSGTTISNIFAYMGGDDAIEFFGGTVSVTNMLAVDMDDDMFDVTQGWHGTLRNAYGIWGPNLVSTEKDPRGVEADGNHDGEHPNDDNQADFTIENITIELAQAASEEKGHMMNDVFKIRRGATATIKNAYVFGTGLSGTLINTDDKLGAGNLTIDYKSDLKTQPATLIKEGKGSKIDAKENKDATGCDMSIFAWTGYNFEKHTLAE